MSFYPNTMLQFLLRWEGNKIISGQKEDHMTQFMRLCVVFTLALGMLNVMPAPADAKFKQKHMSHRIGGFNSHGKGSHYIR